MSFDPQGRMAMRGVGTRAIDQAAFDAGLRTFMLKIYGLMAGGLAVSGLVAVLVANTGLWATFFSPLGITGIGWIAILAPLGILLVLSFGGRSMSAATMSVLYWAFVALQGVSLATLFLVYTDASIVRVFFVTAAAFAGLSLYGYTTQRSLSGMGSFMVMGLIGLVLAMVVNLFLGSSMLQFVISAAGVLIFAGLIAYETQALKESYAEGVGQEAETKMAIWGAINLYLDFLNLFRFLLYFMGNSRN
jgi:FtsH-binding integral membrane protein